MLHGLVELLGQYRAGYGTNCAFFFSILSALGGEFSQHHFRTLHKIAVQRDTVLGLVQMHPLRFHGNHALSLLQEQNVRYYTGSGVGKECIVRQTNGPQQLRPLGQVLPHLGALAVHGVSAGNKGHHAARTHLIQCLGKEIIVDAEAQRIVAFIVHQIVAEGHVSNGKIIEIPPVCSFKARHGNVRIGIELFCNPP